MSKTISASITENRAAFREIFSPDKNYDIIERQLEIGGHPSVIYMIDGFTDAGVLQRTIQFMYSVKPEAMPKDGKRFMEQLLPYGEVGILTDMEDIATAFLAGITCMFIDGYAECLIMDCREYPSRGVQEPEKDKVMRGSRDGFVETLIFNTALIRRRIRDPRLTVEILNVGRRSRTDVALCYMDGEADERILTHLKDRLSSLQVDSLTMNQESLAECLYKGKWFNPFPKFKFSERPDTAAACILQGSIIVLVDNSPAAMILPSSVFDVIEEADDYYFPPVTGTYLRLTRFATSFVALFMTPFYLLMMQNPDHVPQWLQFSLVADEINVPVIFQLLIMEFAIDGLRLASINTPTMLSTPLSVIAAIVLGDYAVESGWFNSEVMLYMAFVALASYSQASFEMGYALKFMRIFLLIATVLFDEWGFFLGTAVVIAAVACNRTIGGRSYLYPLIPFDWKELKKRLFRVRISHDYADKK
ncbi:MAG: spore germination protein [Lachnospiraceae bacterium]|jgi:stage V sporulation protein AF|nr:spore germination protein [Lachnospiraceae bacterium]